MYEASNNVNPEVIPVDGDLVLKQLLVSDRQAYFDLYKANEGRLSSYAPDMAGRFKSPDDVAYWLQGLADLPVRVTEFGLWLPNQLLGAMNLTRYGANKAAIGYWLGEKFVNKGYATKGAAALVDYAFDQPGIEAVSALVVENNPRSQKLLNRIGFHALGPGENSGQKYQTYMLNKESRGKKSLYE